MDWEQVCSNYTLLLIFSLFMSQVLFLFFWFVIIPLISHFDSHAQVSHINALFHKPRICCFRLIDLA